MGKERVVSWGRTETDSSVGWEGEGKGPLLVVLLCNEKRSSAAEGSFGDAALISPYTPYLSKVGKQL